MEESKENDRAYELPLEESKLKDKDIALVTERIRQSEFMQRPSIRTASISED